MAQTKISGNACRNSHSLLVLFLLAIGWPALAQKPVISTQPKSQNVCAGYPATFNPVVNYAQAYQWQFNGAPIPGATNLVYTITNAQPEHAGSYTLVASNLVGILVSSNAVLAVGNVAVGAAGVVTNVPLSLTNAIDLAIGGTHALGLRQDGTVAAWRHSLPATYPVPEDLTNVIAIAAGGYHSLALRSNGTVTGWSIQYTSATNIPVSLRDVIHISSRGEISMAVDRTGLITAWGTLSTHGTAIPTGRKYLSTALGNKHGLALSDQGTVHLWGNQASAVQAVPAGLKDVIAIAAGANHNIALKNDGSVIAWGDNTSGQTNVPPSAMNIVAVAAGDNFSMALRRDGAIIGWGSNYNWNPPATYTNTTSIAAGLTFPLAVRNFGAVHILPSVSSQTRWAGESLTLSAMAIGEPPLTYQWQVNGADIPGATDPYLRFEALSTAQAGDYRVLVCNARGCATGQVTTVSVRPQTYLAAWGANGYDECYVPEGLTNITAFAAGANHGLVLQENRFLKGWGAYSGYQALVPPDLTNAIAIAAGPSFNAAIRETGLVKIWSGDPSLGLTNATPPFPATSIAAGSSSLYLLGKDGRVYQHKTSTSLLNGMDGSIAIAAGYDHILALKTNRVVSGYISPSAMLNSGQAVVPTDLSNVVAVACGSHHSLALKEDGTVVAWGLNTSSQTDVPPEATNIVQIAAGEDHSLALRADGVLIGWGNNRFGQCTTPTGLTNIVKIAAAGKRSFALVSETAPLITKQPKGLTIAPGRAAKLGVNVTGARPVTYRWFFNNLALENKTNATLSIADFEASKAGLYRVVASNHLGSVTSLWAELTLGPVATWGYNHYEQLLAPPGLTGPVAIDAGVYHAAALTGDGRIFEWGNRLGSDIDPSIVAGSIHAKAGVTLAVSSDGTPYRWGTPDIPGPPAGLKPVKALANVGNHVVALLENGTVTCWGNTKDNFGQFDPPAGLSNVVAVAAGTYHSVALTADGFVRAWGKATVPAGLSNVVGIAAGDLNNMVLKADGTVVHWGYGPPLPAGLTNIAAIGLAGNAGYALREDGSLVVLSHDGVLVAGGSGFSNVIAAAANNYHVAAVLGDGRPHITIHPFSRYVAAGEDLLLVAKAVGAGTLLYRWQLNGKDIAGATNSSLTITKATEVQAGEYRCIISNDLGSVTTDASTVTLSPAGLQLATAFDTSGPERIMRVQVTGLSGGNALVLYTSSDLVIWQPVITNTPVAGTWEYSEPATNSAPQFYRVAELR